MLHKKNQSTGVLTRFDTNWPVQPQKMVGSLKFKKTLEELLSVKKKNLCFRICIRSVFSGDGSYVCLPSS